MNPKFVDLIPDIYAVLGGLRAPDPIVDDVNNNVDTAARIIEHIRSDLLPKDRSDRDPNELYVTQFSSPCWRKSWYAVNNQGTPEQMKGDNKFKFLYGDLIEESFLYLAKAAGHSVTFTQERLVVDIPGSTRKMAGRIDAIIDGVLVDVKSCDPYTYDTAAANKYVDKFGYWDQLEAYRRMIAEQVPHMGLTAAIIFINKVNGKMCFVEPPKGHAAPDFGSFAEEMDEPCPTFPLLSTVEDGSNQALCTTCSYCPYKFDCFENLRVFAYAKGPVFLAKVNKEPKVPDITEAYKQQAGLKSDPVLF